MAHRSRASHLDGWPKRYASGEAHQPIRRASRESDTLRWNTIEGQASDDVVRTVGDTISKAHIELVDRLVAVGGEQLARDGMQLVLKRNRNKHLLVKGDLEAGGAEGAQSA